MNQEYVKVFDKNYKETNKVKSREQAHLDGDYHETFQCFLMSEISYAGYIYLAKRSKNKTHPLTFEATASGHILENEEINSGTRELEEELGLLVDFSALLPLGFTHATNQDNKNDHDSRVNELANIFLFPYPGSLEELNFNRDEIEGIIMLPVSSFMALISSELPITMGSYYDGEIICNAQISYQDLTPTGNSYWEYLLKSLQKKLRK